jgi:hypothetical protein
MATWVVERYRVVYLMSPRNDHRLGQPTTISSSRVGGNLLCVADETLEAFYLLSIEGVVIAHSDVVSPRVDP